MSLKEATQRLALLLGLIGAIVGGCVSYSELQTSHEQRASYAKFEQLENSDVVKQERRFIERACAQNPSEKQCGDANYNPMSEVNRDGIKTIYWGKDYQVGLIQTDDGQNLFPTPLPSTWIYLWVSLFWVVPGFFIPWGAVRAIGWAGAGFVKGSQ